MSLPLLLIYADALIAVRRLTLLDVNARARPPPRDGTPRASRRHDAPPTRLYAEPPPLVRRYNKDYVDTAALPTYSRRAFDAYVIRCRYGAVYHFRR